MKNLENYIHLCESYVNEYNSIPFVQISEFKITPSFRLGGKHNSHLEFKIQCTKYALNWLRLNLGYLPEKLKGTKMNDCDIELHYSVPFNFKNIEILKILNSFARTNWNHLISLGSDSCDFKNFTSKKTQERQYNQMKLAFENSESTLVLMRKKYNKAIRKIQNDKHLAHDKYIRILNAHEKRDWFFNN